jgi:tRNA pseudouridine38-40 synthase
VRNIRLTIEYDGTNYHGWQKQPNGLTVQEVLETTIKQISEEEVNLIGSGRTDAGVHALEQVANFKTGTNIPAFKLALAINSLLPHDISVIGAEEVSINFHSQYDAISKTYIYKILNRKHRTAIHFNRVWCVTDKLNIAEMNKAARGLIGKHDFKVFSKSSSSVKTTLREIHYARFISTNNEEIEFHITSNGFLKGMVRMIVGTLVNVGKQRLSANDFKSILISGEKNKYVKSAPAHGLYLAKVEYKG